MFDLTLPPINDMDPPILFPESESKLNNNQLSPTDEPMYIYIYIVSSPPLLTNDSPSTIVTTHQLPNDNALNLDSTILHHHLIIYLRSSSHIHQFRCLQNQLQPKQIFQRQMTKCMFSIKRYNCRHFLSTHYSIPMIHLHYCCQHLHSTLHLILGL